MEPTEEQQQAIYDFVANSEIADDDAFYEELQKQFPPEVVQWWSDTMLALLVPKQEKASGKPGSSNNAN